MHYNEIHRHWVLSVHRVLRRLVSWRDWLWSPSGSQPPDWHPPHGSCRTRGAGRTPARPPAALLAAWCRRPPLAPPPPRLPAARVSGIPLSRCLAVPLSCYREVPAWVLPLSSLGTAPTSGSPCPATQTSPQGGGWGGDTQGSGMLKARSPRCRAQPARRLRVAQLVGGTRTVRFQLTAEPEPGDWHPRTLRPRGAKYCVPREPRRPASRLPTMS